MRNALWDLNKGHILELREAVKRIIPPTLYRPVLAWYRKLCQVRWGSLRRVTPISRAFGFDRGLPIDRYYIEVFLQKYSSDVKARVLEVGDSNYTYQFGGERVLCSDVLHAIPGNPKATLIGDLQTGEGIPENAFDCVILTQVYHVIYNIKTAIQNSYRSLKPGGVLLVTLAGISQISRYDADRWGDYWRLTTLSAQRLFEEVFPPEKLTIESYGNVLTAMAFLHGLAVEELRKEELDYHDPDYQLLITVRAVKPEAMI